MENDKVLVKAMSSFKVLTECPIIVALLYQLHRDFVANMFTTFLEPIINVLALQPAAQAEAHVAAAQRGEIFLGRAPEIQNATLYGEYKSLQVKVLWVYFRRFHSLPLF
jgi:transformation/transcription domain-associated protein